MNIVLALILSSFCSNLLFYFTFLPSSGRLQICEVFSVVRQLRTALLTDYAFRFLSEMYKTHDIKVMRTSGSNSCTVAMLYSFLFIWDVLLFWLLSQIAAPLAAMQNVRHQRPALLPYRYRPASPAKGHCLLYGAKKKQYRCRSQIPQRCAWLSHVRFPVACLPPAPASPNTP